LDSSANPHTPAPTVSFLKKSYIAIIVPPVSVMLNLRLVVIVCSYMAEQHEINNVSKYVIGKLYQYYIAIKLENQGKET
jgi:hypothetical protein